MSAAKKAVVKVRVGGEEYALRTDASAEHTLAVAARVDEAMRAIVSAGAALEAHKVAILAALQLTDELLRERTARAALEGRLEALAAELRPLLPPAKR